MGHEQITAIDPSAYLVQASYRPVLAAVMVEVFRTEPDEALRRPFWVMELAEAIGEITKTDDALDKVWPGDPTGTGARLGLWRDRLYEAVTWAIAEEGQRRRWLQPHQLDRCERAA